LVPTDDGDESSFLSKHIIILDIIFFYSSAGYASWGLLSVSCYFEMYDNVSFSNKLHQNNKLYFNMKTYKNPQPKQFDDQTACEKEVK